MRAEEANILAYKTNGAIKRSMKMIKISAKSGAVSCTVELDDIPSEAVSYCVEVLEGLGYSVRRSGWRQSLDIDWRKI